MLIYKIGITLIPGVGDITAKKLIAYCGGVENVFREKKAHLVKIPGIKDAIAKSIITQNVLKRAEEEVGFIEKYKISPLFFLDKEYPERLKNCSDSPIMLYYKGNANLNVPKTLAIVGTRNATSYGKEICKKIIEELSSLDVFIVSGLAYGIDICSHKAALDNNLKTLAVLGHGLDTIYPSVHKPVAEKMIRNGGILTEFISKTKPDVPNFPKRNRIIAGMADAVLVMETKERGGSLITAEIANSYNRDVFAVPGKINDEYSRGCHYLIKTNKAALVESANDIIYFMNWEDKKSKKGNIQKKLFVELTDDEKIIMNLLNENESLPIDVICYKTELGHGRISAALLNLEFSGLLKSLPGKIYKRI
ncbi:MAG: DNA-processing protein DprA [Bacteroidales bacterium]|nr:DNA-processing protein DprA [Bacteroidales bacterium]